MTKDEAQAVRDELEKIIRLAKGMQASFDRIIDTLQNTKECVTR